MGSFLVSAVLDFSSGLKEKHYVNIGVETGSCWVLTPALRPFTWGLGQVHLMSLVSYFLFTAEKKLIPAL